MFMYIIKYYVIYASLLRHSVIMTYISNGYLYADFQNTSSCSCISYVVLLMSYVFSSILFYFLTVQGNNQFENIFQKYVSVS